MFRNLNLVATPFYRCFSVLLSTRLSQHAIVSEIVHQESLSLDRLIALRVRHALLATNCSPYTVLQGRDRASIHSAHCQCSAVHGNYYFSIAQTSRTLGRRTNGSGRRVLSCHGAVTTLSKTAVASSVSSYYPMLYILTSVACKHVSSVSVAHAQPLAPIASFYAAQMGGGRIV